MNPDFPDNNFSNHRKVYLFARQFAKNRDVLDVGCGTGYGTAILAEVARSVIGIDNSRSAIGLASRRYKFVIFRQMNAENLEFPSDRFDFVLSSENFEHLQDQRKHLQELKRVVRTGGICLIATPNPEMFVGISNPYHTKENSYEELRILLSEQFQQFVIVENSYTPQSETGCALRHAREQSGSVGLNPEYLTSVFGKSIDTQELSNTHSFFCFVMK